jgi:hypothetical protein
LTGFADVVAGAAKACEDAGMMERHPPDPLPTKASDEPEVEPLQFVIQQNAKGEQTLDLVEGSFEQSYRVGGEYTTKLFVELCRGRGLLPYRHRRQHSGTICVRASLSEHEALWSKFLVLSRELEAQLHEVTSAFVKEATRRPR